MVNNLLEKKKINVLSEVGELEGVILHTPGPEVENMTPKNAERALYSDILNLSVASSEYAQFAGAMKKITNVYEVSDLLAVVLENEKAKDKLVRKICRNEHTQELLDYLFHLSSKQLAKELIEGVPLRKNTLTKYLSKERYILRPLHNFFFMRDASMAIRNKVLIGKMANKVREREALIMEAIFNCERLFDTTTVNPNEVDNPEKITIEGGDVLVAREDILLIGLSARTSSHGIDFIIQYLKQFGEKRHILVQELPHSPESFIHLDMVFTLLDTDKCMIYEPVILDPNKFKTIHIEIDNGKVSFIKEKNNLLEALSALGMDLKPIYCGGVSDRWTQEREQWHSGANFFAVGPGKLFGYDRNLNTIEELNKNGFEIISAQDVINGKTNPNDFNKYIVTIKGSELARGGGGCRCMTMPISRKPI